MNKINDVHVPASATVWVVACKKNATDECLAEATLIVTYLTVRGKTHAHHNEAAIALLFDAQQLAKA